MAGNLDFSDKIKNDPRLSAGFEAYCKGEKLDKEAVQGKIVVENKQMAGGTVPMPRFILGNKKLSSNAKLAYGALLHYAWSESKCFPGLDDMMEFLGLSKPTIIKGLRELETAGYVEIKRWGQGKNNTYFLPDRL